MERDAEDRILRIYRILSFVALISPTCSLAGYLVGFFLLGFALSGVDVPEIPGIEYIMRTLTGYLPLILSPVAIIAALVIKFRYGMEIIWPLRMGILFYAVLLFAFWNTVHLW